MRAFSFLTRITIQRSIVLQWTILIFFTFAVSRVWSLDSLTNTWLDQRFDWVVHLKATPLHGYLNYPGSSLNPLKNVRVDYRLTPRLFNQRDETMHFENLWYKDAVPIGCHRRLAKLNLKAGWQGAIYIDDNQYANDSTPALTNAIVRTVLDVSLLGGVPVVVLAPPALVPKIASELGRYNFRTTNDDSLTPAPSVIQLMVSSDRVSDRIFLVYRQTP